MGSEVSKIMQISQAPSRNVHNTLKPFDDASGRKLRSEWYKIPNDVFYDPNNFYISSIAHCYPGKTDKGSDREPPKECALRWLKKEIELVNNKIFIILGAKAAKFFFCKKDFTYLVFTDNDIFGKPAFVLPHPSPLNKKWFKDNPKFLETRIHYIKKIIHEILEI
jgi:uracil-DNA glycosylase family 4